MKHSDRFLALCLVILLIIAGIVFTENLKTGVAQKDLDTTSTAQAHSAASISTRLAGTGTAEAVNGTAVAATATVLQGFATVQAENTDIAAASATALAIQQGEYVVIKQSGPPQVKVGEQFHVNFTLQNIGPNVWSDQNGYQLHCEDGESNVSIIPCGSSAVSWCSAIVKPNVACDITVTMQAPTQPGQYQVRWQLWHNNQSVAPQNKPYMYINITVTS